MSRMPFHMGLYVLNENHTDRVAIQLWETHARPDNLGVFNIETPTTSTYMEVLIVLKQGYNCEHSAMKGTIVNDDHTDLIYSCAACGAKLFARWSA